MGLLRTLATTGTANLDMLGWDVSLLDIPGSEEDSIIMPTLRESSILRSLAFVKNPEAKPGETRAAALLR